jgi:tetratricopeptide (TPR) repeat protein
MRHLRIILSAVLLAAVAAGCAPKTVAPAAPGAPRHPEFVFPAPTDVPTPGMLERLQAAWQTLQGGDTRNAERQFSAMLKRDPGFYPAHAGLGYAAMARDNLKAAIGHFDRALVANGAYASALAGKGQAHVALDERGLALASFDAALAADPGLSSIRSAAEVLRFQVLQGGVAEARQAAETGRLAEARTGYQAAIAASPDSPFLHRELAIVELRDGQLDSARTHAELTIALEPGDARHHVLLADILEAMGDRTAALAALTQAVAIEPSGALEDRIEVFRTAMLLETMPPEFRAIREAPVITRAQLAALIGSRLEAVVAGAPRRGTPVITDTRGNWAFAWILPVTRAGFMEVYPNNTFQPRTAVRRADLAFAASRILAVIAAGQPALGTAWRKARPRFADLPAGHPSYPAAALAVGAGVIAPLEQDAFQLSRPVSGEEAIAAVDRLAVLAETRR